MTGPCPEGNSLSSGLGGQAQLDQSAARARDSRRSAARSEAFGVALKKLHQQSRVTLTLAWCSRKRSRARSR